MVIGGDSWECPKCKERYAIFSQVQKQRIIRFHKCKESKGV